MKYQQDPRLNNTNASVGIAERPSPPVLTVMLCILYVLVFYFYQSSDARTWISHNTFQFEEVYNWLSNQKYSQIVNILFLTNLANINIWQLLASIYVTGLFGIPVEKRLGPSRYIGLVMVACVLPWAMQFFDIYKFPMWPVPFEHAKETVYFFGTYAIVLGLAGAYTVLQPKREKDMTHSRWHRKDRLQIFNRGSEKAMNEKYGLSPNLFFTAYMIYALVSHFVFGYFYKDYDTIGLYAGLVALIGGYTQATFIQAGLQDNYQDHPLKHAAVKHYYELVDLDVGHQNAVKGAAKKHGLPEDQVADWVKKSKGKLRPT